MRVTFTKHVERRVVTWQAVRGKRTRVPGSTMALGRGELPHDLAQLVVEAVLGVDWPTLRRKRPDAKSEVGTRVWLPAAVGSCTS